MSKVDDKLQTFSLEDIAEPSVPPASDDKTREEELDLNKQKTLEELKGLAQDIQERKIYARRIYWLVVGWIASINLMLFVQGFKIKGFELSDGVLIAAITTTTASVVGIFLIVTSYLFPKRG